MNSSKKNPVTKEKLNRPTGAAFFIVVTFEEAEIFYSIKTKSEKNSPQPCMKVIPCLLGKNRTQIFGIRFQEEILKFFLLKEGFTEKNFPPFKKNVFQFRIPPWKRIEGFEFFQDTFVIILL